MTTPAPDELHLSKLLADYGNAFWKATQKGNPTNKLTVTTKSQILAYVDKRERQLKLNTLVQLSTDYQHYQLTTPVKDWIPVSDFIKREILALTNSKVTEGETK